jgi:hypothetical protein
MNSLGSDDAGAIAGALPRGLQRLYFEQDLLSDEGAAAIAKAWLGGEAGAANLVHLDLGANEIGA